MNRFVCPVVFFTACLLSQFSALAADPLIGTYSFDNVDIRREGQQAVKYCISSGTATFYGDGKVFLDASERCNKYPVPGIETRLMKDTLFYVADSAGVTVAESQDMQRYPTRLHVLNKGCTLVTDYKPEGPDFLLSLAVLTKQSCVPGVAPLPGPTLGKREIGVSRRISFAAGSPGWHVVGIGNFDGRLGTDDIAFLRDNLKGEVRLRLLDRGGVQFADAGIFPAGDPNWKVVGVGDFNGDGKVDLAWRRANDTGEIRLHLLNGSERLADLGLPRPPASYQFVGIGDFLGSGTPQILWRVAEDGPFEAWVPAIPAK